MSVSLTVIVPALNEAAALPALLDEIGKACGEGEDWEAIVVDDGSTDGSFELLEELALGRPWLRAVRLRRNFGKSAALSVGFAQSSGKRIVTIDGDGQDDPADIPRLLAELDGADLVSGWKRNRRDPFSRRLASRIFNRVTAWLTGLRMHDMNCGLKAYRGECARSLEIYGELHRYIPVLADQQGWRVVEIPVNHRPRRHGRSRFGAERYLRGAFDLLTVVFIGRYQNRPLHLFGSLGLGMTAIGTAIELYLLGEKLAGNAIGRRPLLVLGLLLIVVGVQFLTFGLLAQMVVLNRRKIAGTVEPGQIDRVLDGGAPSPEELIGGSERSATETLPPA
ncbi:MAG: glycosyltransferase family 2 protein [Chloroflexota bacterium]